MASRIESFETHARVQFYEVLSADAKRSLKTTRKAKRERW